MPIERHVKVMGTASPDDPDLRDYWFQGRFKRNRGTQRGTALVAYDGGGCPRSRRHYSSVRNASKLFLIKPYRFVYGVERRVQVHKSMEAEHKRQEELGQKAETHTVAMQVGSWAVTNGRQNVFHRFADWRNTRESRQ
jgi:hypothetical protein